MFIYEIKTDLKNNFILWNGVVNMKIYLLKISIIMADGFSKDPIPEPIESLEQDSIKSERDDLNENMHSQSLEMDDFSNFKIEIPMIADGIHQFENPDSVMHITFKDGKKNGLSQVFENGRLIMDMTFMDDLLNGSYKYYYPNKDVQLLMNYKNGKLHGDFIQYHPNRVMQMKTTYIEGLQQGVSQTFNTQNILVQDMVYKDGLLDGPMNTYHDRELIGRTYYKEGVEVIPKS